MRRVRKVVFPVAGLGTRMLPATKVLPKEMLPVVDRPIIQYALEEAAAAGAEEFIFVTGRGKTIMEDHFDRAFELFDTLGRKSKAEELEALERGVPKAGEVVYTRQQEPKGLGHAVWCARHLVGDEPFAVMLVDDLIDAADAVPRPDGRGAARHRGQPAGCDGSAAGAYLPLRRDRPRPYRWAADRGQGHGREAAPEVAPSRLAVIGRYVLLPEIFAILDRQKPGAGGEIQLTDAMAALIGHQPFHGYRFEGQRFDCGDKLGYLEAIVAMASRRADLQPGFGEMLARYR